MPTGEEVARGAKRGVKSGSGHRGSVDNAGRLQSFKGRTTAGGADWGGCDPKWLQDVLVRITGMGGAATFGLSRDRGAHSLTLLLDSERQTLWFNGDADLDLELEQVCATLDAMV